MSTTKTTRCSPRSLDRLLEGLPAGTGIAVEYRGYGIREASGRFCGVSSTKGKRRVVLEDDQRHEVPLGCIDSIRFTVARSAELADHLCQRVPFLTSIVLETPSDGDVDGAYVGVWDRTSTVCVDGAGRERRVPLGDVVSLRMECD